MLFPGSGESGRFADSKSNASMAIHLGMGTPNAGALREERTTPDSSRLGGVSDPR
mgnify:CR=1 FL=1